MIKDQNKNDPWNGQSMILKESKVIYTGPRPGIETFQTPVKSNYFGLPKEPGEGLITQPYHLDMLFEPVDLFKTSIIYDRWIMTLKPGLKVYWVEDFVTILCLLEHYQDLTSPEAIAIYNDPVICKMSTPCFLDLEKLGNDFDGLCITQQAINHAKKMNYGIGVWNKASTLWFKYPFQENTGRIYYNPAPYIFKDQQPDDRDQNTIELDKYKDISLIVPCSVPDLELDPNQKEQHIALTPNILNLMLAQNDPEIIRAKLQFEKTVVEEILFKQNGDDLIDWIKQSTGGVVPDFENETETD